MGETMEKRNLKHELVEEAEVAHLERSIPERRSSLRLKGIPEVKRPYYGVLHKRKHRSPNDCLSVVRSYLNSIKGCSVNGEGDVEMVVLATSRNLHSNVEESEMLIIDLDNDVPDINGSNVDTYQLSALKSISERRCSPRLERIITPSYNGFQTKKLSKFSDDRPCIKQVKHNSCKTPLDCQVKAFGRSMPLIMHSKMKHLEVHQIEISDYVILKSDISLLVKRVDSCVGKAQGEVTCFPKIDAANQRYSPRLKGKRNVYGQTNELSRVSNHNCAVLSDGNKNGYVIICSSTQAIDLSEIMDEEYNNFVKKTKYDALTADLVDDITLSKEIVHLDNAPLAVAIVLSERRNGCNDLTEFVYSATNGCRIQYNKSKDFAKATFRSSLALKKNMKQNIPVSIIYGGRSSGGNSDQVFTYCGLYKVLEVGAKNGGSGLGTTKYRLKRLPGQPNVDFSQNSLVRASRTKFPSDLKSLVCEDISFGAEVYSIPVTNAFGSAKIVPPGFKYITSVQVSKKIKIPPDAPGCGCKENCSNPNVCSCARLNGSDFPYVRKDGGRLVEPKDIVYECGPRCGCGPDCINRVSQRPMKYRLEVYRTRKKGWAVRSWDFIPSGAPVCEYTGIVRRNRDLDDVTDNDFIFDIDCWHTMHGLDGREKRQGDRKSRKKSKIKEKSAAESESEFCVDGGDCGNVSRFINHSCEPNLFVQCVLSSHRDMRLARIVLFAADDIPPMQELAYDYGYSLDSVVGPDGKLKRMRCYCGAKNCRGRLF